MTCAASFVAVWLLAGVARASDPVGIYALVDRVVIEPSESQPERVQIWGAFMLADVQSRTHHPPVCGYLYYKINPDKPDACKAEWNDLKSIAGTGQVVAFGSRYREKGRVRGGVGPNGATEVEPSEASASALLKQLDSDKQTERDIASEELARMGRSIEAFLRDNTGNARQLSPEARGRVQKLLEMFEPDVYPLGFGLSKLAPRSGGPVGTLLRLPRIDSPPDGGRARAGKVTLAALPIAARDAKVSYRFEIEGPDGEREASGPVAATEKQDRIEWTPRMQVKSGQGYTWRVWADGGDKATPVATAVFRGTSAADAARQP
jgi:hypothetical protein